MPLLLLFYYPSNPKEVNAADYFEMTQKAVDYIEEHLDERIQVYDLARISLCSEAHFSRIFRAIVGLSVMDYMRGRRLSLAARELALAHAKVLDVALKYGYETPEAFAKAFKRFHGTSPIACRRSGSQRYLERSFPLVAKMKLLGGEKTMTDFGSPLQQILEDLDKASANLYFCFTINGGHYAIKALEVAEIIGARYKSSSLYPNKSGQLCLQIRGTTLPVVCFNESPDLAAMVKSRQAILICSDNEERDHQVTPENGNFGLIIDENPVLKVAKSISPMNGEKQPFLRQHGQFDNDTVPIVSIAELRTAISCQLATDFDKADITNAEQAEDNNDAQKRLEYAAYDAELLARNASIEAVRGMEHHKGSMVIAYELHNHAMELAKIASEMRKT